MKFAAILKSLLLLAATSVLVACGGGSSGGDSIFQPPSIKISATPTSNSASPGQTVDVQVRVTNANGTAVADGTNVNASVSPGNSGSIRWVPPNGAGSDAASGPTAGGTVNFRYTAGGSGNVTLTFSTAGSAGTATTTTTIAVSGTDQRLQIAATRTQLPVNVWGVSPFMGSPYMSEVTVTVRDGNGELVNREDGIQVSINPVDNTGGFSTLDDPETECDMETLDGCEFLIRMGQAPVDVVAGKATIFVHSLQSTGTTTLTITTQDEVTNQTVTASQDFQIVTTTPPLPTQLALDLASGPIYVQGSGGNSNGLLDIHVRDALGQPVPEPEAGGTAYNNYRLEIVGLQTGGVPGMARLSGVNAAGIAVSSHSSIDLRTTAGVGAANFIAGTETGSYVIRLTADRADNNVDNGISDPVTVERSVVVSDGRLFDLEITQPTVNALTINPAGGDIEVVDLGAGEVTIPVSPDGTYSVTVAVIATDRQGNPVLPGTRINFGLIDEPQASGVGDYYIAGGDGNPQEGGTAFTAVDGRFATAGGGVGAGDTLVVFGEDIIGNRDLESARAVTQVHSNTSLSVDYRFNHNDTTGQSVDYGGILPYIIGRAADGNIIASATTNELGVAVTKMNYPIEKLGKLAVIWAQADGPVVAGQPKKVADVEFAYFAGVAPATLVVSPNVIPANTTRDVTVCLYDALGAPMGGIPVSFAFQGLSGSGSVDGVANAGSVDEPTAFGSGCTVARVSTQGVSDEGEPLLVFGAAGATGTVEFTFAAKALMANPTAMTGGGTVTLTLVDSAGAPLPGFQIVGTCQGEGGATISLQSGPGVTNNSGQTTAVISAPGLNITNPDTSVPGNAGSCVFETVDGEASAEVTLQGINLCTIIVSPSNPGCEPPAP
ncbi:hypothetical protein [Denitratimonas sp. CY0512]|uniref:hypothetical protein n=1 Tax=Denitratimonas sp. CY0512 TaxID=3131940 RepID=UPI00309D76CC